MMARVVGAGLVADAFQLAFTLPNTFRRLFAEGAFSVAFVPLYSRALHGNDGQPGSEAAAEKFADDVLSVFVWVLLGFSGLCMIFMPGIVWLLAREYGEVAGKFELSVFLSRVTFPYLFFISLVAMLSGLLNARSRFGPGALAPVLLNLFMISGILLGANLRGAGGDDTVVVQILAGIVLGALIGTSRSAREWLQPTLEFIRPLPASAIVPKTSGTATASTPMAMTASMSVAPAR